jgi:hypothetical protein
MNINNLKINTNIIENKINFKEMLTPQIEQKSIEDINDFIHNIDSSNTKTKNIKKINVVIPKLDFSQLPTPSIMKKSKIDIEKYINDVEKFYKSNT